jgi:hypothetical protein
MSTTQTKTVLVQLKVSRDLYKSLVAGMTAAGDLSLAAFCRHVLTQHVQAEVPRGKK